MKKLALIAAGIATLAFVMGADGGCDKKKEPEPDSSFTIINPTDLPRPTPTQFMGDNPTDPKPGQFCAQSEHDLLINSFAYGWVKCKDRGNDVWQWVKQ